MGDLAMMDSDTEWRIGETMAEVFREGEVGG
jgi:hypothetical protein